MTIARSAYRAAIGKRLGRSLYISSSTTGTSTVNEIVDSTRTEFPAKFDGASVYFASVTAPKTAIVRGGDPTGRLFLDSDLGSVPANPSAYEGIVGWTFDDLNDSIDWAHADAYPALYLPINDTSTTESDNVYTYTLTESWRSISEVWREIANSSPTQYERIFEGSDYVIRHGASGLEYEALYTPTTGVNLRFVGSGYATIGSSDASTSIAPLQLIVPGALAYLYGKGSNADELAPGQKFDKKAEEQMALFERAKSTYRMRPQALTARMPRVGVTNDGSNVLDASDW
jgi:hypothetical protein